VNLHEAAVAAAATSGARTRYAYERAVWKGAANTPCSAEQERAYGALRLLTLATLRLPDLVLFAHLAHACELECAERDDGGQQPAWVLVLSELSDFATSALRLAHRALETHGRQLSYEIEAWIACAVERALEQLAGARDAAAIDDDLDVGITLEQARLATIALARATAATEDDPLLVADQIAHGLGHLLAVYLIAREAGG
jgi:hypothetical protein